jgi:hypothetical protein
MPLPPWKGKVLAGEGDEQRPLTRRSRRIRRKRREKKKGRKYN